MFIYYPGHLAAAVGFNQEVKGDYLLYKNKRYTVCDPTYIGADIGMCMPDYVDENVSNKVVKLIQSYTGVVNKMVWRKTED